MLECLAIENYAVARKVSLNLKKGLTAITGETGAGKSIAIDALQLVLGARAEAKAVRKDAKSANIIATFNLSDAPRAMAYLTEKDLLNEEPDLLIMRRSISKDGKSRAYINDTPVNTQVLKEISPMLINIHGQHDGQLLLKSENQIEYLDAYAELGPLVSEVASLYHTYSSGKRRLNQLAQIQNDQIAEYKLTHYQIAELEKLAPKENEFTELSNEYDRLNHSQTLLEGSGMIMNALSNEEEGILTQISVLQGKLGALTEIDKGLVPIFESINTAQVNLDDAYSELSNYQNKLDFDQERVDFLNKRMLSYTDLARKYNVAPNDLFGELEKLNQKIQEFSSIKDEIEQCKEDVIRAKEQFLVKAKELSEERKKSAPHFIEKILELLHVLSMPKAEFTIKFSETAPQANGIDAIDFLFNANPGMDLDLIANNASGGEISRIALAILAITASKISAPTMIFDEIDTGISGQTAAVTGKLLRKLGLTSQVITVTHLPQVASACNNQFEVVKENHDDETLSTVRELDENGRVLEVARLLGATEITPAALENAKELIKVQSNNIIDTKNIL
ncbi:MAG: DNA repair protein RecN [Succinivibrionaceae bacterium]|nr:DNA repair protein RecN [Ruminobacter sp.]MDY5779516.1 DNA repair protein RecN [Succinivibrionaceae bacterium]MEE1339863.1 DNA repair protein RecN [Succinivibrionaceae bacterium]